MHAFFYLDLYESTEVPISYCLLHLNSNDQGPISSLNINSMLGIADCLEVHPRDPAASH